MVSRATSTQHDPSGSHAAHADMQSALSREDSSLLDLPFHELTTNEAQSLAENIVDERGPAEVQETHAKSTTPRRKPIEAPKRHLNMPPDID